MPYIMRKLSFIKQKLFLKQNIDTIKAYGCLSYAFIGKIKEYIYVLLPAPPMYQCLPELEHSTLIR